MLMAAEVKRGAGPGDLGTAEESSSSKTAPEERLSNETNEHPGHSRATLRELRWWDFFRVPHA
jgi:hypothetical protein